MANVKSKLLPCPFCGGKGEMKKTSHNTWATMYWIECQECFAQGSSSDSNEKALELWNTRYNPPATHDAEKPIDKVVTICYNQRQMWESRESAIADFKKAVAGSEGSERERYMNILLDLEEGKKICRDIPVDHPIPINGSGVTEAHPIWSAVCNGDIKEINEYFAKDGQVNLRHLACGTAHSLIMGALRNNMFDVVAVLEGFGEDIEPYEKGEYNWYSKP